MSIITEALKKAEKERNNVITSTEYMQRILGPTRKETYRPQVVGTEKKSSEPLQPLDNRIVRQKRRGIVMASGWAIVVAIIFLTMTNIYLIAPLDLETGITTQAGVPIEAEPYTDMSSEIEIIKQGTTGQEDALDVMKKEAVQRLFFSRFSLNGIVHDVQDSWAVVNNSVVRVGDTLSGAKILAIEPKKVTMSFRNEVFNLVVK